MYLFYVIISILIIPGVIYGTYAQINTTKTFKAFNGVQNSSGLTGAQMARIMLDRAGLENVKIEKIKGELTDNYNPKTKILSLSDSTFNDSSISAVGVACHEVGHAIQHKMGYKPLKIRNRFVPVVNFASAMFWPLFIVGIILMSVSMAYQPVGEILVWISVAFYGASTLFYLITLPVEFNASKRAIKMLSSGLIDETQIPYAEKVLKAAAQTYVSALVISALYFLRFFAYAIILVGRNKD